MDREQDIPFVYEDGVLKPQGAVNLPPGARGIARVRQTGQTGDEFWRSKSLEELAAEQGVRLGATPADLRGDWPADESIDDFLDALRKSRR